MEHAMIHESRLKLKLVIFVFIGAPRAGEIEGNKNRSSTMNYLLRALIMNDLLLCISEMARDSAVGRERVLIVPGSLQLENAANQHTGVPQNDINQQILEVSSYRRPL